MFPRLGIILPRTNKRNIKYSTDKGYKEHEPFYAFGIETSDYIMDRKKAVTDKSYLIGVICRKLFIFRDFYQYIYADIHVMYN